MVLGWLIHTMIYQVIRGKRTFLGRVDSGCTPSKYTIFPTTITHVSAVPKAFGESEIYSNNIDNGPFSSSDPYFMILGGK